MKTYWKWVLQQGLGLTLSDFLMIPSPVGPTSLFFCCSTPMLVSLPAIVCARYCDIFPFFPSIYRWLLSLALPLLWWWCMPRTSESVSQGAESTAATNELMCWLIEPNNRWPRPIFPIVHGVPSSATMRIRDVKGIAVNGLARDSF